MARPRILPASARVPLVLGGLLVATLALAGCPGSTGDGPDGGCTGVGEPGIYPGFTGLTYQPIEQGAALPAWTRPQGGIGTRINVRATGYSEDTAWEVLRVVLAGVPADGPHGPGELGGACRVVGEEDGGASDAGDDDGGEVDPPLSCNRPYLCDEESGTCVFRIANIGYNQFPLICLDDGSILAPEVPIRFRTFLTLEDVDGARTALTVELETEAGELVSSTVEVVLEESAFIQPETFDPI